MSNCTIEPLRLASIMLCINAGAEIIQPKTKDVQVNLLKSIITIAGALLALSTIKVHATDFSKVKIKAPTPPPTYSVDGAEVNAAEATVAALNGRKVLKCTAVKQPNNATFSVNGKPVKAGEISKCAEMEIQASRGGLSLKTKKD
jgi:hypothetical protein